MVFYRYSKLKKQFLFLKKIQKKFIYIGLYLIILDCIRLDYILVFLEKFFMHFSIFESKTINNYRLSSNGLVIKYWKNTWELAFLSNSNIIYKLQFGLRQQYSTWHALINIAESIIKALDDGNVGCGVVTDFQKAFDTAGHQILIEKLNHYGILRVSNDWFKSYPPNCNQHVLINGYDSCIGAVSCRFPHGFILVLLQFLLYKQT